MTLSVPILENEYWWGGTTMHGYCPLTKDSHYCQDFTVNAPNQTMPLFLSSKGRVIWSESPFKVEIKDGAFLLEGEDITVSNEGSTLKEAYLAAQKKHFPCDKQPLRKEFFKTPQYNSWIQFAYYPTQEKVLAYAHEIIDNGFPAGIFIIDEGWHIHTDYGHWEFDFARFPHPKEMVDELHALGFIVMLWVTPFVTPVGPRYFRSLHPLIGTDPEMAKHLYKRTENGEVAMIKWWNGISAVLDMTNPYDEKFLDDQLQHLMKDYGVDGFKFDGGALGQYTDNNVINGKFPEDSDPVECNLAWNQFGRKYPFHEYKDTFKGGGINSVQRLHDRDHRWVNNGIDDIIPCAVTKGIIGHPFTCPDMVGGGEWLNRYTPGFQVDEELFVRMAQCSALFPMIQFSWAPWEALSPKYAELCLAAAKLHVKMSDEIVDLVEEATETGEPIIRALEYNDPHQGFEAITDEFMLGENILVAPVITAKTYCREVAFPKGTWQDEDGHIYHGRTTAVLDAPIEKLLWFKKV